VKINVVRWQVEGLASMRARPGPFAADPFVARRRRDLAGPTEVRKQRRVEGFHGQRRRFTAMHDGALLIARLGFCAPHDLGDVDLRDFVEEIEDARRGSSQQDEQTFRKGIQHSAMADFEREVSGVRVAKPLHFAEAREARLFADEPQR
jgi:hypothetical protein